MHPLHIALHDGFQGHTVAITVDGREVYNKSSVATNITISRADAFAAESTEMITGHEPCGVIAELGLGAPDGLAIGDRVMVHHYRGCGVGEICAMGYEELCPRGRVTLGHLQARRQVV